MADRRWEYISLNAQQYDDRCRPEGLSLSTQEADGLGGEGWEMVALVGSEVWFKRPIPYQPEVANA